jgi:hypothetical protein
MVRKSLTLVLILTLLLVWFGVAFSRTGVEAKKFTHRAVLPDTAHPWEDDLNKPAQLSSRYTKSSFSIGCSPVISSVTDLFLRLYLKYVVQGALNDPALTSKR